MSSSEGQGSVKDPLIGQVVQGRYQIVRPIGKGAMGVVYEAQHLLIGRKVALKTMAAHASMSPACVKRFRREARAAASVGNSHVVDVLDMGQLGSGSFYMVLEHLDGVDLGIAVAAARRFSVARALHVLCQLCDALSAVHAAGIVHRDLKPENVFLIDCDGAPDFVKVLDFGVCKFSGADAGRLTVSGDTVGTPLFMAPEQAEGRSDTDHRTDIYALGAILYFLLTGHAPFVAQSLPQLFVKICNEPPPSLRSVVPNLPMELQRVVNRALSKDPKRRFDSCSAFKAELLPLLAMPDAGVADKAGFLARASSLRPSRRYGVGTLGLTAVLILAAGATYVSRAPSAEPAEAPPVASPTPPVPAKEPEIVRAPEPEAKAPAQRKASDDVSSPSVGPEQRGPLGPPQTAPAAPTKRSEPDPFPQARPNLEPPADVSSPTIAPEPPADVAAETVPPAPQDLPPGFPLNRELRDDL